MDAKYTPGPWFLTDAAPLWLGAEVHQRQRMSKRELLVFVPTMRSTHCGDECRAAMAADEGGFTSRWRSSWA